MVKRKKRLIKGLESLDKQISIHKEKLQDAIDEGMEELAGYYQKEIKTLEGTKEKKKS